MAAEETHPSSLADPGKKGRPRGSALQFALNRLARRAHSQGELTAKMERAGFPTQQIEETLVKLIGWRYLDDRAFARSYALSAVEHKRWGPARVEVGLRQRGVSEEHIEEALREAFPEGENATLERALTRFRRSSRRRGTAEQEKARAFRHLSGRGFSSAAIWEALSKDNAGQETDS